MTHAILKATHAVLLESMREKIVLQEYEEIDSELHSRFFWIQEPLIFKKRMKGLRGDNFLEAVASIVEWIIVDTDQNGQSMWRDIYDPCMGLNPHLLMLDLGIENLPLLINFFKAPQAIKVLTSILKTA